MYSVKLIASVIAIIAIASVVIILIQSNKMISLHGHRSGNLNSNDSKQNINTNSKHKPSLACTSPYSPNSTDIDTPYVKEFNMPNGTWPNGILVARNGIVWTVGTKSNVLISFISKQGKIRGSYPIPEESENATATIANSSDNHNARKQVKTDQFAYGMEHG